MSTPSNNATTSVQDVGQSTQAGGSPTANVTPPPTPNSNTSQAGAANGTVLFNAYTARQELLALPQYTASPMFPNLGQWRSGQHDVFAVTGPANGPIESVMCVAVGVISREKAFLGTNGTFNARFAEPLKNARSAKWQFTLDGPRDNIHFAQDWTATCNNLQTVQGQIARTNDKRHFLLPGQRLRMGRNIWEAKTEENDTPARHAITSNYPINRDGAQWWDLVKETHQIDLMTVYDVNGVLNTRAETWERDLVGALVEVTFSLRHFYLGVTPTRPEAYDVYSATVESVSVLEKPAPILRSPFQQRVPQTKPRPVPQAPLLPNSLPSTRGGNGATIFNAQASSSSGASSSTMSNAVASTSSSSASTAGQSSSSATAGKKRAHDQDDDDASHPPNRPKRGGNDKSSS